MERARRGGATKHFARAKSATNGYSQCLLTMTAHNDYSQWLLTMPAHNDYPQRLLTTTTHNDLLTMTTHNDSSQWLLTMTSHDDCSQWLLTYPLQTPWGGIPPRGWGVHFSSWGRGQSLHMRFFFHFHHFGNDAIEQTISLRTTNNQDLLPIQQSSQPEVHCIFT